MFHPSYRMKQNGVPVLSRQSIEGFANAFVLDFQPGIMHHPEPFNAMRFVEVYLEADIEYGYLSPDGRFLGMTVFQDHVAVPGFDPETGKVDAIPVNARTVLIDNRLTETEEQAGRLRYTFAHEAGHLIFHETAFRMGDGSKYLCRDVAERQEQHRETWTDFDWMEWQSDVFASCLLMPEAAVRTAVLQWKNRSGRYSDYSKAGALARTFGVSLQAAGNRMRDLRIPAEQKPFVSTLTDDMYRLEPEEE